MAIDYCIFGVATAALAIIGSNSRQKLLSNARQDLEVLCPRCSTKDVVQARKGEQLEI